ncbi:aconitate hydratase [Chromohalobacter canadensis]|uniref:Aconitate hydratase n=1 Tax=Chromohalobacter canadensis TaxID=141389 RepID=A0ABZ0YCL7_9GAMM|nr:aconitate hydratase [Chromohalobacter canadensis]MCK0767577.1 aconitate hydratase [Chromohalobacter canadensis]WQH09822.1 aconitate hydratase [Chromohalobacter canadensis]
MRHTPRNVTQKLIASHLVSGDMTPGAAIGLNIDQTLTQDATGTMVMLELEAMALDRVKTEVSAQYVDHNLIQEDNKNPDDHRFLQTSAERLGVWFSRPGNGVSHPTHQQRFGKPGKTLLGSDSHTPAAGSLGMLAIGAGGIDVAMAMAGEPFHTRMPEVWGVRLEGSLPDWVSAKDVILEMLRRHGVSGGVGCIIEYYGPGLEHLSAMDRHVIANMGAELGATTSVFPSDAAVKAFLDAEGRGEDWHELLPDDGCSYDRHETIDLSQLEPLIATPSSPGNVVPVREVAGEPLSQAYVGSSANPGYRDFAIVAAMLKERTIDDNVSLEINPTSRSILETLTRDGHLLNLLGAGARLHQAGCNGCIGMGQAPANDTNSLRTVPRNFPGRSGTREDRVFLCSPETAAASALKGVITDPRTLGMAYPQVREPNDPIINTRTLIAPMEASKARKVHLIKGPNIESLPDFEPLETQLDLPILVKAGDDVSTDEIMPAGGEVLPYRSNIPRIAEFSFRGVVDGYAERARETGDHIVIGGENYGQGSSREHAAIAPRYLGMRVVIAKSFARIHHQNLVNFGVLPLTFSDGDDYDALEVDTRIGFDKLQEALEAGGPVTAQADGRTLTLEHALTPRQVEILFSGGLIAWMRNQKAA